MSDEKTQDEYRNLLEGTGFVVIPRRTQIELTGSDRASFLHSFCTNDITGLRSGEGCEAFMTSVQGKVLAYMLVFCRPDCLEVESDMVHSSDLVNHLDRYLIREDVELHDRSETWSQVVLSGSGWLNLLPRLLDRIPTTPLKHVDVDWAGLPVSVRSVWLTGAPSFRCRMDREAVPKFCRSLLEEGATESGTDALEIARVEAGMPISGVDVTDSNLPQEMGRNQQTINFSKGCYLGQETIARIDALGHVNWHRVALRFEGDQVPTFGLELTGEGNRIGRVTSAVFSPRLDAPLAMAYIRHECASVGTKVDSSMGGAEVVNFPAEV